MSGDNKIYVELTGRESKLLDMIRGMNDGISTGTENIEKQKKEYSNLEREAQRVINSVSTAQEKYNQTLEKLDVLRAKDLINDQQKALAVAKAKSQLDSATIVTAELVEETRKMPPLWQEIAGGVTAASIVVSALSAAQQFIVSSLREEVELRKEAARLLQESVKAAGPGAQLGDPKFEALQRRLFASGAVGSMSDAANLAFSITSGGLQGEEQLLQRMSSTNFVTDITKITNSFDTFKAAMDGTDIGSFNDVLSKMLVAAGPVVGEMDQMFEQATEAASDAKKLGISDEELLASITAIAKDRGLGVSGARLTAFYRALTSKDEFKGMSTSQIIGAINAKGFTEGELQKYLGSSEASQGFSSLVNQRALFNESLAAITTAPAQNILEQRLSAQEARPDVQATQLLRQEQNLSALENMDRTGRAQTLLEAARAQRQRRIRADGDWVGARIESSMNWLGDQFMSPATALDYELSNERRATNGGYLDGKLESQIIDELKRQTDLMKNQRKAAPSATPAKEQ